MKRCNQCGKIVNDDVNYCPNCGLTYFSSCDTDTNPEQHAEIYEENKTEYGKKDEASASKRRNIRSTIIGITVATAVLISVFVLIFLSDTGEFRMPTFNHYADVDNADEESQELISEQEITEGTTEESAEFVNEVRQEIVFARLDSVDRQATGLSHLMSLDSGTFSELGFKTYEATWVNGSANCIAELPENHIRMYGYFDDEVYFTGVAFDINGEICYFDWPYASVSLLPIQIYWNEDLQQLQVTCTIYHGTGLCAPELYIVKKDDTGAWVSYRYGYEEYSEALKKRLLCVADANNEFVTIVDTQTGKNIVSQVYASDELTEIDVDQFYYGNVSSFNLGDTIVYVCQFISDYEGRISLDVPNLEFELILNQEENGDISFELGAVEAVYGDTDY